MAKKRGHPRAVLSHEARRDLQETLKWTIAKFWADAALRYEDLIVQALRDIEENQERAPAHRTEATCSQASAPIICALAVTARVRLWALFKIPGTLFSIAPASIW